jgi:hypothetical protein
LGDIEPFDEALFKVFAERDPARSTSHVIADMGETLLSDMLIAPAQQHTELASNFRKVMASMTHKRQAKATLQKIRASFNPLGTGYDAVMSDIPVLNKLFSIVHGHPDLEMSFDDVYASNKVDLQWVVMSTQGDGSQLALLKSAMPGGRLHDQGVSIDSVERVIAGEWFQTTAWLWDKQFCCAYLLFTLFRCCKSSAAMCKGLHTVSGVLQDKLRFHYIQADAEAAIWNAIHDVMQSEQSGDKEFYKWDASINGLVDPTTGFSREAGCKWHLVHNFAQHAKNPSITEHQKNMLTRLGNGFCNAVSETQFQQVIDLLGAVVHVLVVDPCR